MKQLLQFFAASLFDAFDGLVARALKVSSRFGVELDSLSDVVSFGAAPSFLIYFAYFKELNEFGILLSAFPLLFGAFRLARFNVMVGNLEKKSNFSGLPIPLAALTIATFFPAFLENGKIQSPFSIMLIFIVIVISFLMVSNVKYKKMPGISLNGIKESKEYFLMAFISFILLFYSIELAFFVMFISIVIFGILRQIYEFLIINKVKK